MQTQIIASGKFSYENEMLNAMAAAVASSSNRKVKNQNSNRNDFINLPIATHHRALTHSDDDSVDNADDDDDGEWR